MIARNYLWRNLLKMSGLVVVFLVAINFIADFTYEIGWLGKGDYHLTSMLIYLALMVPAYLCDLAPIGLLLGFLIALIVMVKRSEIVVLFTSSVSQTQLARWVALLSFMLMAILAVTSETIAAYTTSVATNIRTRAISLGSIHVTAQGVWLRNKNLVMHIGKIERDKLHSVRGFYLNETGDGLTSTFYAPEGVFKQGSWQLINAKITNFEVDKVATQSAATKPLAVDLTPKMLLATTSSSQNQNIHQLAKSISYLKACGMDTRKQEMNLWQRLFRPLSSFLLTMLAVPIALTSYAHRSERNLKLVIGVLLALSFYALESMLSFVGVLHYIIVPYIAAIPSVIITLSLYLWMKHLS